jgi:hypothetical protein
MNSYYILIKQMLWNSALTTCVNLNRGHGNDVSEEVRTTTLFGPYADCNLNWETNIQYVILNISSAYYAGEDSHHSQKQEI